MFNFFFLNFFIFICCTVYLIPVSHLGLVEQHVFYFLFLRMIYAGSFIYFHIMILDTNRPSATFSLFKWNGLSETSLVGFFLYYLWYDIYIFKISPYICWTMSISFMILFFNQNDKCKVIYFFPSRENRFWKKEISYNLCIFFNLH